MSSLLAPRWPRTTAPHPARSARPSLREVCLLGSSRPAGPAPSGLPCPSAEATVPHLGRFYRVTEAQDARPRDARQYLHLAAIAPEPPRT
ncbi:hypothetical protein AB1L88_08290 [Tautonia sp. JC769]|uniref:hypothetical protein n=1 Tax=Tautonia sp. JC769 TaxID=3232135 RepID=UPI0034586E16